MIRFDDGAAYERFMGVWSRLAGEVFLDWVAPPAGLRWADIGCGNGAFTELLCQRCAPAAVEGIDPSEGQLAFARERPGARLAQFHQGSAMALPFPDNAFDAAVMALVIFFVPEPAQGVAEMARVVRTGGLVAAYAWNMEGGGFPAEPLGTELRAMGYTQPRPPHPEAARLDMLQKLWAEAGIEALETREITVTRSYADFDELWTSWRSAPTSSALNQMTDAEREALMTRMRARMPADASGRISYPSRANAIKGRLRG
jgi:ubiquinone/menaquinone biosynthesis C-methylase UbiE